MRKNSGFSLMELLTILGILGILATIAIPYFIGWRNKAQLGRAAQDVYSQFQKAKIEAVRRNAQCTIIFDTINGTYRVWEEKSDPLNWIYNVGVDEEISQVDLATYPGVSLDLTKGGGDGLGFSSPDDGIAFSWRGFPVNQFDALTAGAVFLRNQNNKEISVEISKAGNVKITQLN